MIGRIAAAAIAAVFGYAILSAVIEAAWDATRGMRRHNKPPAAGDAAPSPRAVKATAAPQPSPGPLPGPEPGRAGAESLPVPGQEPRLLMSSRFYSDGTVFVDNHITRKTSRFDPPDGDEPLLTDDDIRKLLQGDDHGV